MNNQATQHHNGPGDNVAGDKNIIQSISPAEIKEQLTTTLDCLRERQTTKAQEHLNSLKTMANLSADSKGLLEVIEVLISFSNDVIPPGSYKKLTAFFRNSADDFCSDITESALLRFYIKKKQNKDANDYYRKKKEHGVYTKEVFYELLADFKEIEKIYTDNKTDLDEIGLCACVRGCLRLKKPKFALTIAKYLVGISPNINNKVLLLISRVEKFNLFVGGKQYWSITATLKNEVEELCETSTSLLKESKGTDTRVIQISVGFLQFTVFSHKILADSCWGYVSTIESDFPDIATQLRLMYEQHPHKIVHSNDTVDKFFKVQSDSSYRKDVLAEILDKKSISVDDASILNMAIEKKELQQWFRQGGEIASLDQFDQDYSLLDLSVLACDESPESIEKVRLLADTFIDNYSGKLKEISQQRLVFLSDRLLQLGLSTAVCKLLKPQFEIDDLWVSPMVWGYLNALLDSHQFETLNFTLDSINKNDWNANVWSIKARLSSAQHKYTDAIDSIEQALVLEAHVLHGWHLLLEYHHRANSDKDIIFNIFKRIPSEAFSSPSDLGYHILSQMLRAEYFEIAEEHLVDWFIQDPDGCAIPFMNVALGSILNRVDELFQPSEKTKKCLGGISYSSDGEMHTRLLVTDKIEKHQFLLSIDSPLGKLLLSMSEGEIQQNGMSDIKLLKKIPPYTAIFSIASILRQAINDGSDCFYSFTVPKDPKDMLASLERKLSLADNREGREKVDLNPKIPLFMKGHHQGNVNPVKSALEHLSNKKSFKHPLPSFGEENPSTIILDTYSIVYLSMTGLASSLDRLSTKTIITIETKEFLNEWFTDINNKDYLTLGVHPEGGIVRTTATDIQLQTKKIQERMKEIIARSKIITPKVVDFPSELLVLENAVDLSVFSSIKLMIANNISWLCIDPSFAQLLSVAGYKVINANLFMTQLSYGLSLNKKQDGLYLHVSAGLPFPLMYEDLILLAQSKDNHAHFFLAELLSMYPTMFSDTNTAISCMHKVLILTLLTAYRDGEILKGFREYNPHNSGYAERVFNASFNIIVQCKDDNTIAYRVALFFITLMETFQNTPLPTMKKLIDILAVRFLDGHFINIDEINKHINEIISCRIPCN